MTAAMPGFMHGTVQDMFLLLLLLLLLMDIEGTRNQRLDWLIAAYHTVCWEQANFPPN